MDFIVLPAQMLRIYFFAYSRKRLDAKGSKFPLFDTYLGLDKETGQM